jgi:hypothetical protein
MGLWYVSALPLEHLVNAWRRQSEWIIRCGSRSTSMSPIMTGERGPQPGGSAWILARAASLSKGARALLAGARDVWTILKG